MRYLKDTLHFNLCIRGYNIILHDCCNVDWIGDANNQKSIISYILFIEMGTIS